ncbi:MAG: hypothetical protein A4E53_04466 [Pelotomaculum sp. PtaB.Bin104]|nr:MAG: hypothetical protein A4E53_04466 [Pelotomaculum sp. PtaB.Bin104]
MLNKKATILIIISLLAISILIIHASWSEPLQSLQVGLLAANCDTEQENLLLTVYEQLLKEEGFNYRVITPDELAGYSGATLREHFEAVVVPEYINTLMPPEIAELINSYVVDYAGKALLVFDPATKSADGGQRQVPLLADLAGVRYYQPAPGGQALTYHGYWCFVSAEKGRDWGITPGKLDQDHAVNSYSYGKIKFEHSRAVNIDARVIALDTGDDADNNPVITEKTYESGGAVVYANMPLGRYKLRSDDLTPRSVLRTFLIDYAKVPRLVNSPGGKGGIVFNLHICSGAYFRALMVMMMQGLFQADLPFSTHITAGPDTYKLGDGAGFFAESLYKGRPVLEVLQNYGEIGSHGGWMHNFFAFNVENLPQQKALQLLEWNFYALETITGKKVREYSDPGGNHPPWLKYSLEQLGVNSYYYAGDSGASPSHPRINGEYGGDKMWAFPISPYQKFASLEEMERGHVTPGEVKQWTADLVDFAADEKTIRMIYTHPSDTRFCLDAIRAFEEKVSAEQQNGRITMAPMSWYADFLNRSAKTSYQIKRQDTGAYLIDLENPESLKDITVAVYLGEGVKYDVRGGDVQGVLEGGWLYLTVTSDHQKEHLEVHRAG